MDFAIKFNFVEPKDIIIVSVVFGMMNSLKILNRVVYMTPLLFETSNLQGAGRSLTCRPIRL